MSDPVSDHPDGPVAPRTAGQTAADAPGHPDSPEDTGGPAVPGAPLVPGGLTAPERPAVGRRRRGSRGGRGRSPATSGRSGPDQIADADADAGAEAPAARGGVTSGPARTETGSPSDAWGGQDAATTSMSAAPPEPGGAQSAPGAATSSASSPAGGLPLPAKPKIGDTRPAPPAPPVPPVLPRVARPRPAVQGLSRGPNI